MRLILNESAQGRASAMLTKIRRVRITGHGSRLRLRRRGRWGQDVLEDLRECSRASMAVDKALGEAIRGSIAAGAEWKDIGRLLGVADAARSKYDVIDALAASKREIWHRYLE